MEERKLSWPERGKLWARLGIRLALLVLALWLLQAVGLPLLSLFAPFVSPVRERARWRSACCMRKVRGATWRRCPRTRDAA